MICSDEKDARLRICKIYLVHCTSMYVRARISLWSTKKRRGQDVKTAPETCTANVQVQHRRVNKSATMLLHAVLVCVATLYKYYWLLFRVVL